MATPAGYTTVENISGMFATFVRGIAQQKPTDSLIQTYGFDVQAEIDAILQRRFADVYAASPFNGSFSAWVASFSADQLDILEIINRYGAALQLGQTLASFGVAGAHDLTKFIGEQYGEKRNALDARDRNGRPLASGAYDKLFNPQARTETSEPALQGIAGGDQSVEQTPANMGSSQVFGKFDKRGT